MTAPKKKAKQPQNTHKIYDDSGDPKYFVRIPRIVWAACRDPYDYTFYGVVKDIAGDNGECWLGTEDLARLCMMSAGKVHDCRSHWLQTGYMTGELVQYSELKSVWHLRITDVWKKNTIWAENYSTPEDRINFKQEKREKAEEENPKEVVEKTCKRCGNAFQATGKRSRRCPDCAEQVHDEQRIIWKIIKMAQKDFIEADAVCVACEGVDSLELHLKTEPRKELVVICDNCHDLLHGVIHPMNDEGNSSHELPHSSHEKPLEVIHPMNYPPGGNSSHERKNNHIKNNHIKREPKKKEPKPKKEFDDVFALYYDVFEPLLKKHIPREQFAMWYTGVSPYDWDGKTLSLTAATTPCLKWMQENEAIFQKTIKELDESFEIWISKHLL